MFYIYWDNECQCELFRGSLEACLEVENSGMMGGGNYNIYSCLQDYHIIEVIARQDENGKLKIILEED